MLKIRGLMCVVSLFGLSLGVVGCSDQKKMGEVDQAAMDAAQRIADLENQLAQAARDRAATDDRLLAMQNELDQLRSKLAEAEAKGNQPEGWVGVPGGAMISIEGTVLFDSGKADLKTSGRPTLDAVVRTIRQEFPSHEIFVFGHTDTDPIRQSKWSDNYELSCQRSLTVLRYLHKGGVDNYIAACGWGSDRPLADNASATGKQRNRRVEIYAMAPVGEPALQPK